MISPALAQALAIYDDQALATLANPGLLRRAQRDVASGKAALTGAEHDTARLTIDGQVVEIGTQGPAKASCDCPAAGVCRHRLAAVLLLRDLAGIEETQGETAAQEAPACSPQEIIAQIALEDARKFAGKPGWRAALELVDEASVTDTGATSVTVQFASLDEPVLILQGKGMAGIVSKASKARRQAYHAAALLAAYRHFDLAMPLEEDAQSAATPTSGPALPDPAFLDKVLSALGDCAQLGFNLAPMPLEESLFALSVSSRADAMPRLSSLLRAIAAQMRLRRQRSFEFDAGRMLELCALAYALCHAVRSADPASDNYPRLVGEIRRSYTPRDRLELIGCGADLWHTRGGARGVTGHFIEAETGRFYSVSIARGAGQDPGFSPRQAFGQQGLWQAGTLAELCHARIVLHNVGVTDDGRLSAAKDVKASVVQSSIAPRHDLPLVHAQWSTLQTALVDRFGLGVEADAQPQMALIHPADIARPQFDELAQRLVWPVRDAEGRWLALTIDHDERSERAIAALEEQLKRNWRGMMLVRASQQGESLFVSPVTLFDAERSFDLTLAPAARVKGKENAVFAWLQRLRPDPGQSLHYAPSARSTAAAKEAWRHLLDRLEAGPQLARMLDDKRAAHAARLTDYGMPQLGEMVGAAEMPHSLLLAAYALIVARQQRLALPMLA